jgi:ABC-type antimicrobial peptide transport system permease subunit
MVLIQALILVGSGVALGVGASLMAARAVGPLLFTVSPWDPWVYAAVILSLMAVAAGAGLIPAWRATRVDPKEALQAE